jgi:hypothetical protein
MVKEATNPESEAFWEMSQQKNGAKSRFFNQDRQIPIQRLENIPS